MRKSKYAPFVAMLIVCPIAAIAEPLESFRLKDHVETSGQSIGSSRLYKVTPTSAKIVRFTINGDSACRYSLQKGALRDFQPTEGSFPFVFSDKASLGDVYILSFSQTRPAWLEGKPCSYSFSVVLDPMPSG